MKNLTLITALCLILTGCCGSSCGLGDAFVIEKSDVVSVSPTDDGAGLDIKLTPESARHFEKLTEKKMGEKLPIYVGDTLVSEPEVQAVISGGSLELRFDNVEAAREAYDELK